MKLLGRLLGEPFAQFMLVGVVVAGLYSLLDRTPSAGDDKVIDVGPGRIAQLYETFSRAWQRPPTFEELNGLIDSFVQEEVFYREGRKMGLDRDDTVFRRRLEQKMQFLMEPSEAEMTPSDAELASYLAANADAYRVPGQFAFRQVYFDMSRRGNAAGRDAAAALATLNRNEEAIPDNVGDATLLPASLPLTRADRIATDFGEDFVAGLEHAESGRWSGPIHSLFGWHLVFVEDRITAHQPQLSEISKAVLRDWQEQRRREIAEQRYQKLRAGYEVTITWPASSTAASPMAETGRP